MAMDTSSRRKKHPAGPTGSLDNVCHGVGCVCSLIMKHSDKVISFTGNTLVWTGALGLKRAIDTTVSGPHYRCPQPTLPLRPHAVARK